MKFDLLTCFGLFSVSLGLVFYALEPKSNWYVLGFAIACIMASVYGFMEETWPFGLVEIAWAIIAFRRFWMRRSGNYAIEPEKSGH